MRRAVEASTWVSAEIYPQNTSDSRVNISRKFILLPTASQEEVRTMLPLVAAVPLPVEQLDIHEIGGQRRSEETKQIRNNVDDEAGGLKSV